MSYDLHGVWDRNNPIGSIVQGHTNLTEIKQATDLLWRNNVPPGKVVLGTGFYGRSFELSNAGCSTPGCSFSGAARKGKCTGEGGILGFFEIQDILKDQKQKVNKIYDEESAVNYFVYDKNQWISYDDKRSFQAKVDWADKVGLGGLMIWAIDLDDGDFTALSGLLGKDVGSILDLAQKQTEAESESWSSMNGQKCIMTKCADKCPDGWSWVGSANSNCKNGNTKKICCPGTAAPSSCLWRGGETGGPGRACHGQCHPGELTLFFDGYGDRHCATGMQVFCCTADAYADLIGSCELGTCGGDCSELGKTKVAEQYEFRYCSTKGFKYFRPWCCAGNDLKNCHWVGKGNCDQNNCDEYV